VDVYVLDLSRVCWLQQQRHSCFSDVSAETQRNIHLVIEPAAHSINNITGRCSLHLIWTGPINDSYCTAAAALPAEVSCGAGPASYMFEGPLKPLSSERVAAPKVPKEFEEDARWHREAADEEATRRRLQGEHTALKHRVVAISYACAQAARFSGSLHVLDACNVVLHIPQDAPGARLHSVRCFRQHCMSCCCDATWPVMLPRQLCSSLTA
jgi:hypothetical protein